jgi:hypothetical protein
VLRIHGAVVKASMLEQYASSKMSPRRRYPGPLTVVTVALLLGCGQGKAPPPGVSTGRAATGGAQDAGGRAGNASTRSARLDGGAILPIADEEVVLPLNGPIVRRRIVVEADPGVLDVHFSVDATASIGQEIDQLQQDLTQSIVPQLQKRVANVSFGVSKFEDFPAPPFGSAGNTGTGQAADKPFVLLTPITSDVSAVASAVGRLDQPLGEGGDVPEAGAEALWQIATGKGYSLNGAQLIAPYDGRAASGGGSAGGVGFRPGALRVVLHITDASSHTPEDYGNVFPRTHTLTEAGMALLAIQAKVVGIVSGACDPAAAPMTCSDTLHQLARADLEQVALLTGAVGPEPSSGKCPNGIAGKAVPSSGGQCPLVFDVDAVGAGLSGALVDAIAGLIDGVRFMVVTGDASDDPLGFVQSVEPVVTSSSADAPAPMTADLLPKQAPDGHPDSFVQVSARAELAFDVALRNRHIAATDVDQSFRAVVQIVGDGLIIAERTLRVRIPAGGSILAPPDADGGR